MSDSEFVHDSDQDVSESHSKLIESITQLDKGQRVKKAERNEPSLEVSEFHLVKSGISDRDAVQVHDLAKVLGKKGHHLEITKKLDNAKKKTKILSKPLEKPAAERIKRIVGYENTTKELKKWNAIITKNRVAETIKFPLAQSSMRLEPSQEFIKRFRLQSDLEKELAALEPQKENIAQKTDEFSMTLKEVIMQRKDAAKLRAQQSYKEAKARRQNKIKSKKFHRVQKKERVKLQLKEFEELQKTDPQAALEKLEQLDKSRAEERMSLRHKSTGQWAKNKQIRAKYDKETRQELAHQLSISRDLTQKIKKSGDSDDESEEDNAPVQLSASDKENPWVGKTKSETEVEEFVKSYRKYWDDKDKQSKAGTLNTNEHNNKSTQEVAALTEDSILGPNSPKGQKSDFGKKSLEILNDQKVIKATKSNNKQKLFQHSSNKVTVTDKQAVLNEKETKSDNKGTVQSRSNKDVISVKKPMSKTEQTKLLPKVLAVNKKNKSSKMALSKYVCTSLWDVESVETEGAENASEELQKSNSEHINKIFDSLEDSMQSEVESKLQRIKQQYGNVTKNVKGKTRNRSREDEEHFDGLEFQAKKRKPVLDEPLDESSGKNNVQSNGESDSLRAPENNSAPLDLRSNKTDAQIDPNKYINVKPKHLNTDLPDIITGGDEALDDSDNGEEKHNIISEAFADDDVVEEFRKEKEEEIKRSQPEDIDLTLPGWGSWGGRNIRISNRKKKRFIMKFPKDVPRRDENKGDVIIFEENKPKIRQHQVSDLPHPFTRVKDFEASVRMPIGRNFVSENAHRKLIQPAVKTSLGTIIEPMDEDVLVKMPGRRKNRKPITKKRLGHVNKKNIANKSK